MMFLKSLTLAIVAGLLPVAAFAADQSAAAKPAIAKICTNCHKAEPGAVRGYFDNVAFKAKTIQVRIDDAVELIKFDEDDIKVINGQGKTGDGDFLKDNRVKKGHEVKVEYVVKDGIKNAVRLIEKPPVKVSDEMLMKTADIERLVMQGPEKGKYFLYDSRPLQRFQEGSIPTAVSLPFPSFDKLAEGLLPKEKNALIIFYCAGPACNMSPGSAAKAAKLGYTNLKVYKDGMPSWLDRNYGVLSTRFMKEAWVDKDIPHVLLDVRPENDAAKGFIKGAVSFPAGQSEKLISGLDIKKNSPIMVYDRNGGMDSASVASALVKGGYKKVLVLTGGFDAWQAAGFDTATGKPAAKATYTPKPRPGEITVAEFENYVSQVSENVAIIDVRNPDEAAGGMFKGARLIPAEELKARSAEVPKDKPVITHCSTGVRAEMAYHTLRELGFTNVRFVNAKIDFEKNGTHRISKE